jgi:vitamin B12 transporter
MFDSVPSVRFARRSVIAVSALVASVGLFAQSAPADHSSPAVALDRFVLSASRTPQDPHYTPSSVTVLSLEDLHTAQVTTLAAALNEQPGVILYNTGAVGGQSGILLRGANSDQTLFVVDGVRMNDRSAEYLNFLGSADLGGIDRLEVLRGPQSTLYGSSAMGGVILVNTAHGSGTTHGTLAATGGSFDTLGGSADLGGAIQGLSYAASVGRFVTENDRPHNASHQWNAAARLEYAAAPGLLVGATFRGLNARYDEPGSRLYPFPGTVQSENALTTVYGEARAGEEFTSRLTVASHLREYTWRSGGFAAPQSNNREILDWQNTWTPSHAAEIVAGANFERSRYVIDGRGDSDRVSAGYVSGTLRPADAVTLTGGVRYDHYRSVGSATTGRAGLAWLPVKGTKLHATYGTGFNAPSVADRYGVPDWGQLANPSLVPEKSRGWDAGIEQEFADGTVTLSATYFQNKFRNLFEWEYVNYVTYEGRTANRSHASTDGIELAATARVNRSVQTRVSYTYLDAHNDDTGARLIRRPRHNGDAELRGQIAAPWTAGVGLHFVASNMDYAAFGGYTTARVFTSYAVRPDLLLKVRVENALNRRYEEVYGYPALPRGFFGSVEWKF